MLTIKKSFAVLLILVLLICFSGCHNRLKSIERDIAYGDADSQKLDLYIPHVETTGAKHINGALLIHGGGWEEGDKRDFRSKSIEIAEVFFIVASMNYRMTGEGAKTDDMLADITSALTAMQKSAADEGYILDNVFLMGYSAGAHLALLYAYKEHANSPVPIAFVVGCASPIDLTDPSLFANNSSGDYQLRVFSQLIGAEITRDNAANYTEELRAISPITYVTPESVPTILLHGTLDPICPYSAAERLADALAENDIQCEMVVFEDSDHVLTGGEWDMLFFYIINYYVIYM